MSTIRRSHTSSLWITIAILTGAATPGCSAAGASHAPRVPTYAFQFSQCMRANGIPNFPDPRPSGVHPPTGIDPASPAYESAQNACKKYLPPSKPPPPTPQSVRREELAWATCMRANGVPSAPDPNANGDIQFPVGDPLLQSPAFQRANNGPCKKYGRPGQ
jgi:hypothetical protein